MANTTQPNSYRHLPIALERDTFTRTLIRHLSGTLEDVVGLDDAAGFISTVGQKMGDELNVAYRQAAGTPTLTRQQVSDALVDLKARIQGEFFVIEEDDQKIVLGNHACPFGKLVEGRRSLCMMTSNVFGVIAAENLGYSRIVLEETIAEGHRGCRVVVHLKMGEEQSVGREYFKEG